ncbi:hypothetical protein [Saccharospirillum impatiens]|uniref:hypothetical protein n=1 Tax=Saccharospirillum impatiens TaxID=169438 RepID=UPI00048BF656|nr:hypothetical protein [Saccharospirillum impatiens]
MRTYGFLVLGIAAFSIVMAVVQSPGWLIGGLFSVHLAWQLLSKEIRQANCKTITKGKVLTIWANGTFLGGHHQPLHNAEIAYLDTVKEFKNLPPNFIHDVSPGDVIEIKYNAKKPDVAFVNFSG